MFLSLLWATRNNCGDTTSRDTVGDFGRLGQVSEVPTNLRLQRNMQAFENITVFIPVDSEMKVPEYGLTAFVASMRLRAVVSNGQQRSQRRSEEYVRT